jgi:hypothetical protein
VKVFEQQSGFFKGTFFAGGIDAHENLSGWQDGRETVHGLGGGLCTPGGALQQNAFQPCREDTLAK